MASWNQKEGLVCSMYGFGAWRELLSDGAVFNRGPGVWPRDHGEGSVTGWLTRCHSR